MRRTDDSGAVRKKLEDYSYLLSDNIGKGYSSQVFKGRHDLTSTKFFTQMKQLQSKLSICGWSKDKFTKIYSPHKLMSLKTSRIAITLSKSMTFTTLATTHTSLPNSVMEEILLKWLAAKDLSLKLKLFLSWIKLSTVTTKFTQDQSFTEISNLPTSF